MPIRQKSSIEIRPMIGPPETRQNPPPSDISQPPSTPHHRPTESRQNNTFIPPPAAPTLPLQAATMLSLRSVLGSSTRALRHLLPSASRPTTTTTTTSGFFFSRQYSSQLTKSLTNGLQRLRGAAQGNVASLGSSVRQIEQVRGMKTRSSVKRLCDGCKV